MELNTVYVTVGTTKFDRLIQAVIADKVLQTLKKRGCSKLILQIGAGRQVNARHINTSHNIQVEQYEFKFDGVRSDIINSDLIIGHAGAGTCMDILKNKKPGLVVVNRKLMNNHQIELAEQLSREGYIYFCSIEELHQRLETLDFTALKPYVANTGGMHKFVKHLNYLMSN